MTITLATGTPDAKADGDTILLTIPSGEDSICISLDLNQTIFLARRTQAAAIGQIDETRHRPVADVIQFPRRAAGGAA